MKITVNELSEREGVDYQTASGLLRYLREKGYATVSGTRSKAGTKGRNSLEYEVPEKVELTFTRIIAPQVTETLVQPEVVEQRECA